mmetsp:Transcript_23541/g.65346  ORF Transcript_23541/g.65346 Transcript_23541/m.65346 type:complete len:306 (+) Transcript_23541:184-1101(+)
MGWIDLHPANSVVIAPAGKFFDNGPDDVHSVGSTTQCLVALELRHVVGQGANVAPGDVGWIAHHHVEGTVGGVVVCRTQGRPVATGAIRTTVVQHLPGIFQGSFDRHRLEIDCLYRRVRHEFRQGYSNHTRSAANIQYAQGGFGRLCFVDDHHHQFFRFGPRAEEGAPDGDCVIEKIPFAEDVLDGFVGLPSCHHFLQVLGLFGTQYSGAQAVGSCLQIADSSFPRQPKRCCRQIHGGIIGLGDVFGLESSDGFLYCFVDGPSRQYHRAFSVVPFRIINESILVVAIRILNRIQEARSGISQHRL